MIDSTITIDDMAAFLTQEPYNWYQAHCSIIDKEGNTVWLCLNRAQLHTEQVIEHMERTGQPVRVVVLKARQLGETTRGTAKIFKRANIHKDRRGLITAHTTDSSVNIFRRINKYQQLNPEPRAAVYERRNEITYADPHGSMILVETGGKEDLGRGLTYDDVHVSELSRFPMPAETMLSVNQCVPSKPGTMICVESTALGYGGFFYDLYANAKTAPCDKGLKYIEIPEPTEDDWNGYYRVFNPWFIDESYRMRPPHGFIRRPNEQGLVDRHGLDDSQLYWRRWCIKANCGGDEVLFDQEYPETDLMAFIHAGRPVLDPSVMRQYAQTCREPIYLGQMSGPQESPVAVDIGGDWLRIWKLPEPDHIYAIGADTAEGKNPTEGRSATASDAHDAHVEDVGRQEIVAKIAGRFNPDIFGHQLDLLGRWYNDALLGAEVNNTSGGAVRQVLKDCNYPNLYYKEIWIKTLDMETDTLGWETTLANRGKMIMDIVVAIREHHIILPCADTVQQLREWQWDKNAKAIHPVGKHDDACISLCITWQMGAIAAIVGAQDVPDQAGEYASMPPIEPQAYIGGVEPNPEEDDDDCDYATEAE